MFVSWLKGKKRKKESVKNRKFLLAKSFSESHKTNAKVEISEATRENWSKRSKLDYFTVVKCTVFDRQNAFVSCKEKLEVVVRKCCVRKVFLEIWENSQVFSCEFCEISKKETLAQVFSCEFWETSKNTFLHRTPLVIASVQLRGFPSLTPLSC